MPDDRVIVLDHRDVENDAMQQTQSDEDILTVAEVAKWLRQTEAWVRAHSSGRRKPRLPGFRAGKYHRYRRGAVREWMRRMEQEAQR